VCTILRHDDIHTFVLNAQNNLQTSYEIHRRPVFPRTRTTTCYCSNNMKGNIWKAIVYRNDIKSSWKRKNENAHNAKGILELRRQWRESIDNTREKKHGSYNVWIMFLKAIVENDRKTVNTRVRVENKSVMFIFTAVLTVFLTSKYHIFYPFLPYYYYLHGRSL